MSDTTDSENYDILEVQYVRKYEEFAYIFNITMKMKIMRMQLLNKQKQNTKRHQKIRKVMRMTHLSLTNQNARKFVVGLRRYFMQEGNEGSPISALDTCADFVHLQSIERTRQGTLDKFLHH
ncbi:hypothetical protein L798_10285 [Zootermopsis nevadensis]|uniref:Uncharacterized protein n=1 Tax=Zootermopsis nevadensis TaxID=136037 RepID=A0A067R1B1_ZOONE|nr:hypothetical protein L798_10285 [Zootermopsis nevadensis]